MFVIGVKHGLSHSENERLEYPKKWMLDRYFSLIIIGEKIMANTIRVARTDRRLIYKEG